ncbi:hypothetical protein GCM10007320_34880 [Pseudorhodoferax aquiterrae]|uniref:Uncharacterized protein n=1 Tax=Pseudorhodoferax aquiterrae TaxID=747304 RepID=A0ABQ3G4V0_9BURK|nr:hypothetical protein GCM10007320_34880 [Pseudorhodoferax aquiterrae]
MDSQVDRAVEAGRSAYLAGQQRWANPYGLHNESQLDQMQALAWTIGWMREYSACVMRRSNLGRAHLHTAWESLPPCP